MSGNLELILGGMFGGKTSELLFRVNRYEYQGKDVIVFSPELDTRYSKNEIVTHDGLKRKCVKVDNTKDILLLSEDYEIVGIDEGQMMDENLPEIIDELTEKHKTVLISALPYDFRSEWFPLRKTGNVEADSEKNISEIIKRTIDITWKPSYCMEEIKDGKDRMCGEYTFLGQRYMPDGSVAQKSDPTIQLGTSESGDFERSYKSKCWKHFRKYC